MSKPETLPSPSPGAKLLKRLMHPGQRLMMRLRLRAKLLLVSASLVVPLCLLMATSAHRLWQDRQLTQAELEGVSVVELVMPLIVETQRHRSATVLALAGEPAAAAALSEQHRYLTTAVAALHERVGTLRFFSLDAQWAPLRAALDKLATGQHAASSTTAVAEHSQVIESLRQLLQHTAERSALLLDPDARAYHLMDIAVNSLVPLAEGLAQTRGQGTELLRTRDADAASRAAVFAAASLLHRHNADLAFKLGALQRAGGEVPGSAGAALEQVARFSDLTRNLFGSAMPTGNADDFLGAANVVIGQVAALHRDTSLRLGAELRQRQDRIDREILLDIAGFGVGMLALGYLLACFISTSRRALSTLQQGVSAIAGGNLAHQMEHSGRDELGDVARVVEAMSARLSSLVSEIRNSASLVNLTGQQVSDGSSRLATRTDEQASSLRSSVSAINQLAAAVADNAQAAQQLDALTGRLAREAEVGNEAMQDTVQAMEQLRVASDRVAEVVAVIDDVAFQTSMLSLNAAIEASRAGEAGKGFAVVATEVRQLAQRCAESAEEIRSLIGNSSAQVRASSEKLAHASGSLAALVAGVKEVSAALRTISTSSTEQSTGLQLVTQTVGNLDEITRENAALVEESSTASNALVSRAAMLREAVASMRLRQGSAEEALDMVRRAKAHVEQAGRDQALLDFHDPNAGFLDRDLYIFSFDREGIYVACGAKPANVGREYSVTPGLDASFMSRIWQAAELGGGWVRYEVINPLTGDVSPKESYVLPLDHSSLIGCGIYRNEPNSAAKGRPRPAAWSKSSESALVEAAG